MDGHSHLLLNHVEDEMGRLRYDPFRSGLGCEAYEGLSLEDTDAQSDIAVVVCRL